MKLQKFTFTFLLSLVCLVLSAQTPFTPGNLLVLRADIADATANSQAVPVSVIEINQAGSLVQTINIPSTEVDRLVLSTRNASVIEGFLTLSADEEYVNFAGYDAAAGASDVQNTSGNPASAGAAPRTVGRFDASGTFSAIKGGNFPGGNSSEVRSAVQADNGRAWVTAAPNYLRFVDLTRTDASGATSTWSTSAYNITDNNKVIIFNNQIYFSSASSTANGLYVVNTNNNRFPVSSSAAKPAKLTIPGLGTKPNGFVFFDTNEDAIPDLLYIADEDADIGLQKYYYDGTNWTVRGTIQVPAEISEKRLRDLTGVYENGKYIIYSNTTANIFSFTDEAAPDANISANIATLASAGTNYVFRGIAFTPGTKRPYPRPESYASRIQANTDLIGTITSNVTYRKFPGIEETHLTYTNKNGKLMAMFFVTADLANPNVKIEAAMPNGGTSYGVQTVRNQINYKNTASAPDFKVMAATNGDYWDINGEYPATGTPLGTVYMNGTMVKEYDRTNYFFMSIMKDGTAQIGDYMDYTTIKSDINYALGGRFYLVRKRDEYIPTGTTDTGTNPRTAVGTLSPTKLIFAVIDGRRPDTYSAGLTLTEVGKLYRALGVTDALNMDGGGSSTLVTKDVGDNSTYEVRNSPSDGSPRSVANTWMILGRTVPILPVSLKSFTGEKQGNYVRLNWATASESNNSHFEIYRSDSKEFSLPIATVQGAGDSNSITTYGYTDANPFTGINYYQLNQVDFDGKSEKSNIIAVNTGMQQETLSIQKEGENIKAIAYSVGNAAAKIRIADITGRLISEIDVKLQKGQNYIPLNMPVSRGVYILTLYADGKSQSVKFIK